MNKSAELCVVRDQELKNYIWISQITVKLLRTVQSFVRRGDV